MIQDISGKNLIYSTIIAVSVYTRSLKSKAAFSNFFAIGFSQIM